MQEQPISACRFLSGKYNLHFENLQIQRKNAYIKLEDFHLNYSGKHVTFPQKCTWERLFIPDLKTSVFTWLCIHSFIFYFSKSDFKHYYMQYGTLDIEAQTKITPGHCTQGLQR